MIDVEWVNEEKNAIALNFGATIDGWGEYRTAVREAYERCRSQKHIVHIVFNAPQTAMPSNPLKHIEWAILNAPANCGMVISVVKDMYEKRILEMSTRTLQSSVKQHVVTSMEAAEHLINNYSTNR